jgi:hypothetical protein
VRLQQNPPRLKHEYEGGEYIVGYKLAAEMCCRKATEDSLTARSLGADGTSDDDICSFGAMLTYNPILATGERFLGGLITGGLISAELWLGAFLILRAILY